VTGSVEVNLTVEPGSALPVTTVSLLSTGLTVGADGAVVSVVDEVDELLLEVELTDETELETTDELTDEDDTTLEEELEELETGMIGVGVVLLAGSMVVAGPVGAGSVGVTRVQVTIPVEVAGLGTQVVPGRVTVSPGVTPVHLTVLSAWAVQVGATGGVWSTTTVVGAEVVPVVGLVWVTVSTVPLAGMVAGIHDHVPLAATTGFGVQTGVTRPVTGSMVVILTVLPGVPVPEIGEPSVGLTTGAAGEVVAALEIVVVAGADGVLPGSVAVTVTTVPVAKGVARLQV
jgi:hypothetical protein